MGILPHFSISLLEQMVQEWKHFSIHRLFNDSWMKKSPLDLLILLSLKHPQIVGSLLLARTCCQLKFTLFTGTTGLCHVLNFLTYTFYHQKDLLTNYWQEILYFGACSLILFSQGLMYNSIDYKLHLCDSILL